MSNTVSAISSFWKIINVRPVQQNSRHSIIYKKFLKNNVNTLCLPLFLLYAIIHHFLNFDWFILIREKGPSRQKIDFSIMIDSISSWTDLSRPEWKSFTTTVFGYIWGYVITIANFFAHSCLRYHLLLLFPFKIHLQFVGFDFYFSRYTREGTPTLLVFMCVTVSNSNALYPIVVGIRGSISCSL